MNYKPVVLPQGHVNRLNSLLHTIRNDATHINMLSPSLNRERKSLDERSIEAIEAVLAKGHRAEVIPTKDGVRVVHVKRETVKEAKND